MCLNLRAQGKGTFYSLDAYKFQGEFQDDLKNGAGEEIFPTGLEVKGLYISNSLSKIFQIRFPDGTLISGDFICTNKSGEIPLIGGLSGMAEILYGGPGGGEKYIGNIKNGKKEGVGVHIWPDGKKYEGEFANDLFHGKGVFTWPDGVVYNGGWKMGIQHGSGVEKADGREREGEWENGKWLKWK